VLGTTRREIKTSNLGARGLARILSGQFFADLWYRTFADA